jgi:hypothetical protein
MQKSPAVSVRGEAGLLIFGGKDRIRLSVRILKVLIGFTDAADMIGDICGRTPYKGTTCDPAQHRARPSQGQRI